MNPISWLGGEKAASLANLRLEFGVPITLTMGFMILLLVGVALGWFYLTRLTNITGGVRWAMVIMRMFAWMLVVFLVLNPALVGEKFDPGQNYLLMLFDDSRSMRIPMTPGMSRGQALREAYAQASSQFETVLRQRYALAKYRFGERLQRMDSLSELQFDQKETRLEEAIAQALADFEGISVAGVLVFSDGIRQPSATTSVETKSGTIPVMTIGVGDPSTWQDLALNQMQVSRSFGDGRPVRVQLNVEATGLAGRSAVLELLQEDRVVVSRKLTFSEASENQNHRLEVTPDEKGWLVYKARIRLDDQEADAVGVAKTDLDWVPENNQARFLVDNRDVTYRIFYFSGRPNWEHKFVQRSLLEDPQFDLVSVLRISAANRKFVYRGKRSSMVNPLFEGFDQALQDQPRYDESVFLRFGGDKELAGRGYPEDSKEMFTYDLMILGDIEANFFSQTQLALTREFIRKRGGTLLMLGGPFSFTEGGWRGTAMEAALPVMLEPPADASQRLENFTRTYQVSPTLEGQLSGVLSLDKNADQNQRMWRELPALAGLHGFSLTRVGATVMAQANTDSPGWNGTPVFASQRYGEGRSAIMATVSTWPWELGTDHDSEAHGQIWRQMMRHLVADTPKPVSLDFDQQAVVEDKALALQIRVRDTQFDPKSGARISLNLIDPKGESHGLPVEEELEQVGHYRSQWTPTQPGLHTVSMKVVDTDGKPLGEVEEAFWAQVDDREYRQAASQPHALQKLARTHGGEFFKLENLKDIPDRIPWTKAHVSETVRFPLWHFPGFFLLLVGLWLLEWTMRRKRGHA